MVGADRPSETARCSCGVSDGLSNPAFTIPLTCGYRIATRSLPSFVPIAEAV
ncbi:hypothetical protein [Kingella potus]|uniref:hypothetical protein n=1 Tax=Kingella potus TaxID=265175 RepID=UPI001FD3733D|nr:hypothetical protein [Kingella potus]UOP00465.1 hypothetical protein LVJ84_11395 [Kingella potus]